MADRGSEIVQLLPDIGQSVPERARFQATRVRQSEG
jgi:hypothetical protein